MALYYLDTSALVKRYIDEIGSQRVKEICSSDMVATSWLSLTELASALARRTHHGDVTKSRRDEIVQAFLQDSSDEYLLFAVSSGVLQEAADMLLTRPPSVGLRSLDAIHLATAQRSFRAAVQTNTATGALVSADRRLLDAADWAGIAAENPRDYQG
jgi:hypothetical protein